MATQQDRETYWRSHWLKWRSSGETQRRYCELQGLSFHEFAKWRTRLKDTLRCERAGTGGFVPLVVSPLGERANGSMAVATPLPLVGASVASVKRQADVSAIEVRLCGGRSVVISGRFEAAVLRELIGVLEGC